MSLEKLRFTLRKDILDIVYNGQAGHIGGDLSVIDIMLMLYEKHMNISLENKDDPNRDYFILSKGHAVEALYAVLAHKGFLDLQDVIARFNKFGSPYIGHPNNKLSGIEMNSGSLGHGLPVSVGIAKACKMDNRTSRIYTITGDGELAEGSVWEGLMAASHYNLDNLCLIIDRNRLQISGTTEEVMHHESLEDRIKSFGWHVISIDGNNLVELDRAFREAKETKGKPTCIIANTIKGCGISFMENKVSFHHHVPSAEEYKLALLELKQKEEEICE